MVSLMARASTADPGPPELERFLDQFDQAWRRGEPPRIEEFVARVPLVQDQARRKLIEELIKLDLEYRWRSGLARPRLEECVTLFASDQPAPVGSKVVNCCVAAGAALRKPTDGHLWAPGLIDTATTVKVSRKCTAEQDSRRVMAGCLARRQGRLGLASSSSRLRGPNLPRAGANPATAPASNCRPRSWPCLTPVCRASRSGHAELSGSSESVVCRLEKCPVPGSAGANLMAGGLANLVGITLCLQGGWCTAIKQRGDAACGPRWLDFRG
jgi:hypothetical protein